MFIRLSRWWVHSRLNAQRGTSCSALVSLPRWIAAEPRSAASSDVGEQPDVHAAAQLAAEIKEGSCEDAVQP